MQYCVPGVAVVSDLIQPIRPSDGLPRLESGQPVTQFCQSASQTWMTEQGQVVEGSVEPRLPGALVGGVCK